MIGIQHAQQKQQAKITNPKLLKLAKYDIAVTDIYADSGCFLTVKFENKGNVEINHTLNVKVWVNGLKVRDQNMLFDHLKAGNWRAHTYSGYSNPIIINGAKTIRVTVGTIPIWREPLRNNTLKKSIRCKPSYDIAVTDLYVDKNCILWVKFQNKGRTRIHTKLHFKLWINRRLIRDEDMLFDDFKPGQWRSHGYTGVKPIKILRLSTVRAWVDTTKKLTETNESNNSLEKKLLCKKTLKPKE
jgi:hypothetical protein